ncbi:g11551 [Coccomyxa elongata]
MSFPLTASAVSLSAELKSQDVIRETLHEAWEAVEDKFVDPYSREAWKAALEDSLEKVSHTATKEEGYEVIQGMLATMGDRYTRLLPPSQARSFEADTTGQVVHVGMQAQRAETDARPFLRVSFVLTGSPAHEAGLQVGDILHTINERPAASLNHTELTALLHQSLHVQVEQSRPQAPMAMRDIHLLARPVEVYPVIHSLLPRQDGGLTGYVAIQSFGTNTAHDTAAAIAKLQAGGASAFVLDLRGNSGGLVNAGLDVAGVLKHRDDVFCYIKHRDGVYHPIYVESEGVAAAAPLAVLVNGGTASTSELLAGALHAGGRAAMIGEHTFGKGRTQKVLQLRDNSTLLVSNSLVITPALERIDKVGLEPDRLCRSGSGPADALKTEPLEADTLAKDLQADQCVQMALGVLHAGLPTRA